MVEIAWWSVIERLKPTGHREQLSRLASLRLAGRAKAPVPT
jgi:hypothetical protein